MINCRATYALAGRKPNPFAVFLGFAKKESFDGATILRGWRSEGGILFWDDSRPVKSVQIFLNGMFMGYEEPGLVMGGGHPHLKGDSIVFEKREDGLYLRGIKLEDGDHIELQWDVEEGDASIN